MGEQEFTPAEIVTDEQPAESTEDSAESTDETDGTAVGSDQ